jgi:hypothetical protein
MRALKSILLLGLIIFLSDCKKDGKGCWQAFNPLGEDVLGLVLCDKTKAEAEVAYPQYWFYRSDERKYCWLVQIGTDTTRAWGVPESMAKKMEEVRGYRFSKIDCNFCFCQWVEKHKSKITGLYIPASLITEFLLSPDSCSKLSVGKVVIVRETVDSLITRELINKHP